MFYYGVFRNIQNAYSLKTDVRTEYEVKMEIKQYIKVPFKETATINQ